MALSTLERIIQNRELKNEKTVALVRMVFALTLILDFLIYFEVIDAIIPTPSLTSMVINVFMLVYATSVLLILSRNVYRKFLKYFVVILDYAYIVLNFVFDPTLTDNPDTLVWFAFAAALIFYCINLLRHSRASTIFTAVVSMVVFLGVCINFGVPVEIVVQVGIALALTIFIGYAITTSNISMVKEANTKQMMERYLPPQLVGELYNQSVSTDPGGQNRKTTILFSDIRSFTTLSESMEPKQVVSLLNDYLSTMTDVIFTMEGTIDKFIGDAIMTTFGVPIEHEDDSLRAVRTAIGMNRALREFNQRHSYLKKPLEIGIGIHTGEVIAGNIGSDKRLDYTVIGDSVNLCSRIESLTKYYSCSILISQETKADLDALKVDYGFLLREIDQVQVQGKSTHELIYEVVFD